MATPRVQSVLGVATAVLAAAVLAACQSAEPSGSSRDDFRIAICGGLKAINADYLVAEKTGALAEVEQRFSINIELVSNLSGPNCTTPLASGEIPVVSSALVTQVGYAAQGKLTTSFLQAFRGPAVQLMGAKKYQDERGPSEPGGEIDWQKWDGARVATTGTTTATGAVLRILERTHGVKFEEVVIPDLAAFGPALKAGRVDAFIANADLVDPILDRYGYNVVNFNSDEAMRTYGFIPPAGNYGALPATLKENAELVQAIVDALMGALRKIQAVIDDPAAIRAMLPETFVKDISDEKWALQWNAVKGGFRSSTGGLTQDELESAVANFAASGIIKSGATIPGAVVTNRFVRDFWARSDHAAPNLPAEMSDIHVQ